MITKIKMTSVNRVHKNTQFPGSFSTKISSNMDRVLGINDFPSNNGRSYYDSFCKQIQMYTFSIMRYPCYSYDRLMEQAAQDESYNADRSLDANEFNHYIDSSTRDRWATRRKVLIVCSSLYVIKNFYIPWQIIATLDFSDTSTNGTNIHPIKENLYQFLCLQTNCTQFILPRTGFTLDPRLFPVIPTCHPLINLLYPPTTYLGPIAMILHAVAGWYAFILGVILPLNQTYRLFRNDALMFLLAPRLTRKFMMSRVKEIYNDYIKSLKSFVNINREKQHFRLLTGDSPLPRHQAKAVGKKYSSQIRIELQSLRSKQCSDMSNHETDGYWNSATVKREIEDSRRQHEDRWKKLVNECLPIARSYWWQSRAKALLVRAFLLSLTLVTIQTSTICIHVYQRVASKSIEIIAMRDEIVRSNCSAWVDIAPGKRIYAPHSAFDVHWDIPTILDNIPFLFLLLTIPCLGANYYLVDRELTCWRLELQNQMQILSGIIRFQIFSSCREQEANNKTIRKPSTMTLGPTTHDRCGLPSGSAPLARPLGNIVDQDCTYEIDKFRRAFFENNELRLFTFWSNPFERRDLRADGKKHDRTKLNGLIGIQQLAVEIMSEIELTSDGYLNLMEKMYISFRVFMEYVKNCSDTTPPLTILSLILNGGLIVISVVHSHLLGQFNYEHLLAVVISCTWAIVMIALMSNFHAKVSSG